ncbi:Metallo-dependent phosphatase [Anaeromyces robustus]|uniref:Metallo-dependent phosphatase n=1 Tax=Anaeromyces robustus TaxID=1754192 RepID=A0A1Y1X349_9FUNG|nr:Metallo-dependent phosphatase [Anaeromyces robustus]|eukprot:ORX80231.1 Metallo-dependent phosphatase [Anaeromyces robustus]
MSVYFEDKCIKYSAANKLPEAIQWKDTLISKGKEQFPRKKYKYRRIVALGDIHGDYNKLESILRHAKLIDKNNDWIGTDSILVQIGDLTDRGPNFKDVVELFIKIRKQAQKKGGIVYMLLGNHELYDMQAGYFMILKSDFDSFGGYLEREKAISMEGKYGELLRKEMNLTMVVDDNLFVHSFLNYRFAKRGLNELNKHVKDILSNVPSFDELLEDYYNQNKTHPIYTDPIFDMTNGPLWSREYIDIPEEEVCEELEKVLKIAKSKRMIIGHTVQEYGKIQTKCQDKLILIDLGLSTCLGNYFGYLEILNNKREIWARYQTKKN